MRDLSFIYKTIARTLSMYDRFTPNRFILILNTGFAESGYTLPPKDGFWQLEYDTVVDLLTNVLPNMKDKSAYFDLTTFAKHYTQELHDETMLKLDEDSLAFQIRMVDMKYRTDPLSLPHYSELWQQGKYWKRIYNTIKGAGTIEHFIREVRNVEITF